MTADTWDGAGETADTWDGAGESSWDGYAARWSVMRGGLDPRDTLPPVRAWMRAAYRCGLLLAGRQVAVDALTTVGLVCALATPLAMLGGRRWALLAAGLVLITALAEALEGAVRVITARATSWGTVYDAVVSRAGEACWLTALWLAGAPGWLAAAACGAAWFHEYTRLQATMAGVRRSDTITMAERPMRITVAAGGLAVSGAAALYSDELAVGAATMAATVWVLIGLGGLIQLADGVRLARGRDARL